jgi:hypothetical protein
MHMHRDVGVAETAPGQAHPFAPVCSTSLLNAYIPPNYLVQEVQDNHDGLYNNDAHLPAAGPPEAFPGVQPHAAPPADIPPANGLRNLASRFLNNLDTLVNMLRIEPGPGGRFVVWIALELAEI